MPKPVDIFNPGSGPRPGVWFEVMESWFRISGARDSLGPRCQHCKPWPTSPETDHSGALRRRRVATLGFRLALETFAALGRPGHFGRSTIGNSCTQELAVPEYTCSKPMCTAPACWTKCSIACHQMVQALREQHMVPEQLPRLAVGARRPRQACITKMSQRGLPQVQVQLVARLCRPSLPHCPAPDAPNQCK